jgi:hypothetical protein
MAGRTLRQRPVTSTLLTHRARPFRRCSLEPYASYSLFLGISSLLIVLAEPFRHPRHEPWPPAVRVGHGELGALFDVQDQSRMPTALMPDFKTSLEAGSEQ